jgi:DNA-binding beta-propeller fold protein YncE
MKNSVFTLFGIVLLLSGCQQSNQNQGTATPSDTVSFSANNSAEPTLQQVWATDSVLITPESVLYDQARNIVYVANINGDPREKDGNGFISRLNPNGQVENLKWVEGLNAPKGMGIHRNMLYVTDLDEIVAIDLENASISNRFPVQGAKFLNDITVSPEGIVYATDSDNAKIHKLENGTVSVFLEGDMLNRPNGLYYLDNKLLLASSGDSQLKSIDLDSKEVIVLTDGIGHGDGIAPTGNGDYLVSNWQGEVFYINSDWQLTKMLDTKDQKINSADIDFIQGENLLLVPTFFDNRVVAYRLTTGENM